MPRYIITGGPGAGKSSLLMALQNRQYRCKKEVSRILIGEALAVGSASLPWIDLPGFAEKALGRMIEDYTLAEENEDWFFDRGIPDIVAYLQAAALKLPDFYISALQKYPYAKEVIILPPWKEIYVRDTARWQTFEEAVDIYEHIREAYRSAGYRLTELPKCPVDERAGLIEQLLKSWQQKEYLVKA